MAWSTRIETFAASLAQAGVDFDTYGWPRFLETMKFDLNEPCNYQRFRAEMIRVGTRRCLDHRELIDHARIISYMDDIAGCMVIELSTYVMGLPEERIEVHAKYPTDWWQALKERWFPQWALRRWPVEYRRIDVSQQIYKAVCPHVGVPEQRKHLEWLSHPKPLADHGEDLYERYGEMKR